MFANLPVSRQSPVCCVFSNSTLLKKYIIMPNGLIAVFQSCTRRNRKCYVIDKTSSFSSSSSTPVATKPFFSYSNRVLFGGLSVQVQPHENKLLPPRKPGPEALRVSPVFHCSVSEDAGASIFQCNDSVILHPDPSSCSHICFQTV